MGQPLIYPDPRALAASVRVRLRELLPAARSGRGQDLELAAASLESAIGDLGVLHRALASTSAAGNATCLLEEIEACRGLAKQLAALIEQARDIRLAHWTPSADGTYTPQGGPAQIPGPRLVRQLG